MRISQLRAFVVTADKGSFTAAGRELGISQPSVSELVRGLETECGLKLFVRLGRHIVVSEAGHELLPWARRAVQNVAGAEELARALNGIAAGVAAFGVLRNAQYYFLSNLVEEFHRAHPGVRIRQVGQNSADVARAVMEGEIEAGLVVLPVTADGLDVKPLRRDEVLWASADESRTLTPMAMSRIPEAPLILYDAHIGSEDPTRRQLVERAQRAGFELNPIIEVENVDTALALVARGIGDTLVARAITTNALFPSGVFTTTFEEPLYDVLALVTRRGAELSPVTRELVTMALALLATSDTEPITT